MTDQELEEWRAFFDAWQQANPHLKRVTWTCSHGAHDPTDFKKVRVPTPFQKRHQTVRSKVWGISDRWTGQAS